MRGYSWVAGLALALAARPTSSASFVGCLSQHRANFGCGVDPSAPSTESCNCLKNNPIFDLSRCIGVDAMADLAEMACQHDPVSLQRIMRLMLREVAGAPQSRSASSHDPCDPATVAAKTKECVGGDAEAVECIRATGDNCNCLQKALSARRCLGACWSVVETTVCAPQVPSNVAPGATPINTAAVDSAGDCDLATVADLTKQCISSDAPAVVCLQQSGSSQCGCLRGSPTVQQCLGPCWPVVESSLCQSNPASATASNTDAPCDEAKVADLTKACVTGDEDALVCLQNGKDNCDCLKASPGAQKCLGSCWTIVQAAVCPTDSSVESEPTSAPAQGLCDPSTVTELTKYCVGGDPDAVRCLQTGRRDCDCVRESHFVLECLGGCWETVESALCFDGDSITMSEQDSKVMSPNDDESIGFDGASGSGAEETSLDSDAVVPETDFDSDGASSICTQEFTTTQTKHCVQEDATALACVRGGGDYCACLTSTPNVENCLGECWEQVRDVICKHPSDDAEESRLAALSADVAASGCDATKVVPLVQACVAADQDTIECVRNNESECQCLRTSATVQACLGSCWSTVETSICEKLTEVGKASVHPSCDEAALPTIAGECVKSDPEVVKCIGQDGGSHCSCLRSSSTAKSCIGNCWSNIEASICTDAYGNEAAPPPPPDLCDVTTVDKTLKKCIDQDPLITTCIEHGGEDCHCYGASPTFQECLGDCWHRVRIAVCNPAEIGTCNLKSVHSSTKACFTYNPAAMQCLRDTGDECSCLRTNKELTLCLGDCAAYVERSLCGCNKTSLAARVTNCSVHDIHLRTCLKSHTPDCDCLRASMPLKACLGDCWAVALNEVCSPNYDLHACNRTTLLARTKTCVTAEVIENSICHMLENNDTVKNCFGPCWKSAKDALCTAGKTIGCSPEHTAVVVARCAKSQGIDPSCFEGTAVSQCECLKVPEVVQCLGPCHSTAMVDVCGEESGIRASDVTNAAESSISSSVEDTTPTVGHSEL